MNELPDRVRMDSKAIKIADKIDIFTDKDTIRKEQFMFALAFGFNNKTKMPLKDKKSFFHSKLLQGEEIALINAVAMLETGSLEILTDIKNSIEIAEEYAHGGLLLLYDQIQSTQLGSYDVDLEEELIKLYNNINFE